MRQWCSEARRAVWSAEDAKVQWWHARVTPLGRMLRQVLRTASQLVVSPARAGWQWCGRIGHAMEPCPLISQTWEAVCFWAVARASGHIFSPVVRSRKRQCLSNQYTEYSPNDATVITTSFVAPTARRRQPLGRCGGQGVRLRGWRCEQIRLGHGGRIVRAMGACRNHETRRRATVDFQAGGRCLPSFRADRRTRSRRWRRFAPRSSRG